MSFEDLSNSTHFRDECQAGLGPNNLVFVCSPSECLDQDEPPTSLTHAYPVSSILGRPTAEEIFDSRISDQTLPLAISSDQIRLHVLGAASHVAMGSCDPYDQAMTLHTISED